MPSVCWGHRRVGQRMESGRARRWNRGGNRSARREKRKRPACLRLAEAGAVGRTLHRPQPQCTSILRVVPSTPHLLAKERRALELCSAALLPTTGSSPKAPRRAVLWGVCAAGTQSERSETHTVPLSWAA